MVVVVGATVVVVVVDVEVVVEVVVVGATVVVEVEVVVLGGTVVVVLELVVVVGASVEFGGREVVVVGATVDVVVVDGYVLVVGATVEVVVVDGATVVVDPEMFGPTVLVVVTFSARVAIVETDEPRGQAGVDRHLIDRVVWLVQSAKLPRVDFDVAETVRAGQVAFVE